MKRSPLNVISAKRRKENVERRKVVAAVFERDNNTCQFASFVNRAWGNKGLTQSDLDLLHRYSDCFGRLTPHEMAHSRNVGRLNPGEIVSACIFHNELAEDRPELCQKIGWSVKANGYPISHVKVS